MLGIPFPQLLGKGSRAEMFKLGACHDDYPQIFVLTPPLYGISHLVRQQGSDKLHFAAIPFLTPPFHAERAAGSRAVGMYPKTSSVDGPWG